MLVFNFHDYSQECRCFLVFAGDQALRWEHPAGVVLPQFYLKIRFGSSDPLHTSQIRVARKL